MIPKFGFKDGFASLDTERHHVFQGELLQLYVVIPQTTVEKFPWLKVGQPAGETAWDSQFSVDICLRYPNCDRSALVHFHAESHSSPGCSDGAVPPSKRTILRPNGDILVALETIISISNADPHSPLLLEVSLLQPAPPHTQALYKAFEGVSPEARSAALRHFARLDWQAYGAEGDLKCQTSVTVIQLLRISTRTVLCGEEVGVGITVTNQHPWIPASLLELSIHSPDKQQPKETALEALIERFDKRDLPVLLLPCESYNFVFFVNAANTAMFSSSRHCSSRFTITWTCDQTSKPVMLQQNATWNSLPRPSSVLVTLQVKSPVCVNREFAVHLTVANNHSRPFNFTIVMLPVNHPWCARDSSSGPPRGSEAIRLQSVSSKAASLSRAAFSPLRPTSPPEGALPVPAAASPARPALHSADKGTAHTQQQFAVSSVFSPLSPTRLSLRSPFLPSVPATPRPPPPGFTEAKAEQEHSEPPVNFTRGSSNITRNPQTGGSPNEIPTCRLAAVDHHAALGLRL